MNKIDIFQKIALIITLYSTLGRTGIIPIPVILSMGFENSFGIGDSLGDAFEHYQTNLYLPLQINQISSYLGL